MADRTVTTHRWVMGKLVFGIITVALLEVAFIGYAMIDGAHSAEISELRTPYEEGLELARVSDIPEFFATAPEVAKLRSISAGAQLATDRARGYATAYLKPRRSERVYTRSTAFRAITTGRTGPGIPSGYTMVLVDYLEGTPDKPKITYFNTKPKAKVSIHKPAAPSYFSDDDDDSDAR